MLNTVNSCSLYGLDGETVEAETDIAPGKPIFAIVGLTDKAIQEATQRLRAAIKNSGVRFPSERRVIVNLAPADNQKTGAAYDLPIAVGVVLEILKLKLDLSDSLFIGELSLEGKLRPVVGTLSVALYAKERGFRNLYLPRANLAEADLIPGLNAIPLDNLKQLIDHLTGVAELIGVTTAGLGKIPGDRADWNLDLNNVKGQHQAKRALEIAAAGGHNLILNGPPGSGKTLLAKTLPSILPPLSAAEILEVTKIYSVAGRLPEGQPVIWQRPFRAPHHSSSGAALIGGGRIPMPGEISLAHRGVLFLDEFAEFPRLVLETLRQPLEDGIITVSRAAGSLTFPARFTLIASKNPCPCGFATDPEKHCVCSPNQISNYNHKISGPILDRLDLQVEVPRLNFEKLQAESVEESSAAVRERVLRARQRQANRFSGTGLVTNAEMGPREIQKYCVIDGPSAELLKTAMVRLQLSGRAYHRLLKTARTIADLAGSDTIKTEHMAEALQYRSK